MSELSDDDIKNIRRDGNRGWFHFTLSDKDIKLLDKWHENARSGNNFTYIDESKPDPYADEESWLIPGLTQDASTGALGALPTKEWLEKQEKKHRRRFIPIRLREELKQLKGERCVLCGKTEDLQLHHADGNPSNNESENLNFLCYSCHLEHTKERKKRKLQNRD